MPGENSLTGLGGGEGEEQEEAKHLTQRRYMVFGQNSAQIMAHFGEFQCQSHNYMGTYSQTE